MPVGQTATPYWLPDNVQVPTHASAAHSHNTWTKTIRASDLIPRPLSINIPFCRHHCSHTLLGDPSAQHKHITRYLKQLEQCMAELAQQRSDAQQVQQLHWIGDSLTLLSLDQMSALVDDITTHFSLTNDATLDFSIDLDPRKTSLLMLRHLQALGVNRINFSVVELDPEAQSRIGRTQTHHQLEPLIDEAQRLGMRSFGLDLWIGLPGQNEQRLTNTLHRLIELAPSGLRLFELRDDAARLPAQAVPIPRSTDNISHLHKTAQNVLNKAGYKTIATKAPHLKPLSPMYRIYAREGAACADALEQQGRWQACEQLNIGPSRNSFQTELTPNHA